MIEACGWVLGADAQDIARPAGEELPIRVGAGAMPVTCLHRPHLNPAPQRKD